jgi:opacity protein-like surface antigen
LALLFAFAISSAFAQKGEPVTAGSTEPTQAENEIIQKLKDRHLPGFFGFGFSNSIPQGDYMSNLKNAGPGFGIYGGYRIPVVPISLGAEVDFHFYKSDEQKYKYKINNWTYVYDTLNTSNSSIPISLFARIEPNLFNFFFPYVEGFAGMNIMSASYDMKSSLSNPDSETETDVAFYYGVGAGAQVKLTDFILLPDGITRMLLDVRFRYMKTGSHDYHTVVLNSDGSHTFTIFNSPTDQVLFTLGLVFHFGR